jgi:hypothetical protein
MLSVVFALGWVMGSCVTQRKRIDVQPRWPARELTPEFERDVDPRVKEALDTSPPQKPGDAPDSGWGPRL